MENKKKRKNISWEYFNPKKVPKKKDENNKIEIPDFLKNFNVIVLEPNKDNCIFKYPKFLICQNDYFSKPESNEKSITTTIESMRLYNNYIYHNELPKIQEEIIILKELNKLIGDSLLEEKLCGKNLSLHPVLYYLKKDKEYFDYKIEKRLIQEPFPSIPPVKVFIEEDSRQAHVFTKEDSIQVHELMIYLNCKKFHCPKMPRLNIFHKNKVFYENECKWLFDLLYERVEFPSKIEDIGKMKGLIKASVEMGAEKILMKCYRLVIKEYLNENISLLNSLEFFNIEFTNTMDFSFKEREIYESARRCYFKIMKDYEDRKELVYAISRASKFFNDPSKSIKEEDFFFPNDNDDESLMSDLLSLI
jgi:hypothetical protein